MSDSDDNLSNESGLNPTEILTLRGYRKDLMSVIRGINAHQYGNYGAGGANRFLSIARAIRDDALLTAEADVERYIEDVQSAIEEAEAGSGNFTGEQHGYGINTISRLKESSELLIRHIGKVVGQLERSETADRDDPNEVQDSDSVDQYEDKFHRVEHFQRELVRIYSSLELARRALPELPNDPDQKFLTQFLNMLLEQIFDLEEQLHRANSEIENLDAELARIKIEANSKLAKFLKRSSGSVADQVGPTIKWLITSGSVSLIAAEAISAALG